MNILLYFTAVSGSGILYSNSFNWKIFSFAGDKQFYQQLHTLVTTSQPSLNKEYPPEWILMYLGPMMRQLDEFRRVRVQKRFQEILQMELSDQEKSE